MKYLYLWQNDPQFGLCGSKPIGSFTNIGRKYMRNTQDTLFTEYFGTEFTDIREIELQEAKDEINILEFALRESRIECENWKNSYNSAMNTIVKFCIRK